MTSLMSGLSILMPYVSVATKTIHFIFSLPGCRKALAIRSLFQSNIIEWSDLIYWEQESR